MTHNDSIATERVLVEAGEFQGRPFRRYSDNTVKAATSQGWVAFQSFEALRSYHHDRVKQRQEVKAGKGPFQTLKKLFA